MKGVIAMVATYVARCHMCKADTEWSVSEMNSIRTLWDTEPGYKVTHETPEALLAHLCALWPDVYVSARIESYVYVRPLQCMECGSGFYASDDRNPAHDLPPDYTGYDPDDYR